MNSESYSILTKVRATGERYNPKDKIYIMIYQHWNTTITQKYIQINTKIRYNILIINWQKPMLKVFKSINFSFRIFYETS